MALIFYISSLHEAPLPQGVSDKSGHSLGYFGFGIVVARAVAGGLPARITLRILIIAMAIAVGYAITDEFHQLFVPGRSADVHDLYADTMGALAGVVACWAWGILSIRPGANAS
jgi:VanZ family protein